LGKVRRHKKVLITLGIIVAVFLVGGILWMCGPPVSASTNGPFISAEQAKVLAEKTIADYVSNPPSSDLEWNEKSEVTYMQPEYDLVGNIVAYDCRVETDNKQTGGIFVTTQGKGNVHSVYPSGKATCDMKTQTALGRDAKEGDYIINVAECGYDVALKSKNNTYIVAEMSREPKTVSERTFLWHAWWYKHNPLQGYIAS
jgi:hypothetical protein